MLPTPELGYKFLQSLCNSAAASEGICDAIRERLEGAVLRATESGGLQLRSRARFVVRGRPAHHRAGGRVHRGDAGHRTRRQRRFHSRQRPRSHRRLSDYRSGDAVDHAQRRPLGAGPRARLRSGDRLRTGAGAGQARRARARNRRLGRGVDRRTRRGRRFRRPAAFGRRAYRRQAGIRRLLGICPRRGDLHRAGASELGRHRADRSGRRSPRHRLAAAPARRRKGPDAEHQHDDSDRSA